MVSTYICPVCGSQMFHDKGNHIIFCAECDHVGWPHDASAILDKQPQDSPPFDSQGSSTDTCEKQQNNTTITHCNICSNISDATVQIKDTAARSKRHG